MTELAIEAIELDGSRVRAEVSHTPDLRRFLTGEAFFVEYDADVSEVPEGVLSIPALAQVCPVAWALGADVRVPVVDRRFLHSLRAVGAVLSEMYPSFMRGGTVIAGEAIDASAAYRNGSDVGMLFTGGVDSMATYARHRDEDPTLINVQGWLVGIDEDDRWKHAKRHIESYGRRFDADTAFIRSNMLSFLETPMLSAHFSDEHDGGWYSAVGGGLGLLGLCAPLAVARDVGTLYIAASHWNGFPTPEKLDHWGGRGMPWGSHPDLDGNVAWGETEVIHDGFELTRQDRVGVVADFIESGHPDLPVRACEHSDTAGNCGRCEKCFRTAFGLAIEGVDPNRHGFDLGPSFFEHARERLEAGDWLDDQHHAAYWQEFQVRLSADAELPVEGGEEFVDWLLDADPEEIAGRPAGEWIVRAAARHVPYSVYSKAYPAYASLKRIIG